MKTVDGIAEIIRHFEKVGENVVRSGVQIPKKISDSWVLMINITGSIDSGDMLRAVNHHPVQTSGDLLEYLVDTSDNPNVNYAGMLEGGTVYFEARNIAQRAVEREDFVSSITDPVEKGLG